MASFRDRDDRQVHATLPDNSALLAYYTRGRKWYLESDRVPKWRNPVHPAIAIATATLFVQAGGTGLTPEGQALLADTNVITPGPDQWTASDMLRRIGVIIRPQDLS